MEEHVSASPKLIDLAREPDAFVFEEGFSRPNWPVIKRQVEAVDPADLNQAWCEFVREWLGHLQADLGGGYRTLESSSFFLLSNAAEEEARLALANADAILEKVQLALGKAAYKLIYGKDVVLLFSETDDYYQYISYFHPEGTHPFSGGCLLGGEYLHIAIPAESNWNLQTVLVHEITHLCLCHLDLPLWLNEGMAQWLERVCGTRPGQLLDHELRERHLAFWNAETIQGFWAGSSFWEPGDSNELSYNLAEVLVQLLLSNREYFPDFVLHAQKIDAGQTAALDFLGVDLGELTATFLGEGEWRPVRKAMVQTLEAYKKTHRDATAEEEETGPKS